MSKKTISFVSSKKLSFNILWCFLCDKHHEQAHANTAYKFKRSIMEWLVLYLYLRNGTIFALRSVSAGSDTTSNTYKLFGCIQYLHSVGCTYMQAMLLHPILANNRSASNNCIQFGGKYTNIHFSFNFIIASTENNLNAGNYAATNICKQLGWIQYLCTVCKKLWVIL